MSLRDGFNILTKKWHAKVRQEEREIGGGNEEIRGVEKLEKLPTIVSTHFLCLKKIIIKTIRITKYPGNYKESTP